MLAMIPATMPAPTRKAMVIKSMRGTRPRSFPRKREPSPQNTKVDRIPWIPAFAGMTGRRAHCELEKRLDASLRAAEDQCMNIMCALVRIHRLQVREDTHHVVFL